MRKNKGFTLIELLVVIAIIGILASVVLASLNRARRDSRDARRISDIKQLQLANEMYFDTNRQYAANLAALTTAGLIGGTPVDPVGNTSYSYATYSSGGFIVGVHYGASLEGQHTALNTDRDCNSITGANCPYAVAYTNGGFNGGSGTPDAVQKCNAADVGSYCYDVVP